jgi:predicted alpha/beta-fold hydrolase
MAALRAPRAAALAAASVLLASLVAGVPGRAAGATPRAAGNGAIGFRQTVASIEALPYQPAYVPVGTDSAFAPAVVPNDFPAEDYTSGSIPGSPDNPAYPAAFHQVVLHSFDGAPLIGELAMHPGNHPAVLVVHGFNTHGIASVVRWAAMLAANGYDVLAADQRDYSYEYSAGYGYPDYPQTFGWKEAQDVLAAGQYLKSQPGVTSVGVVGFSEGAQNTVLAMAQDTSHTFAAGLTFSGPADQNTQIYSSAAPPGCSTPDCTYPATDALVALVVPPYDYTDPCTPLDYAASYYQTTGFDIMARESAFHAQQSIRVPLLNFYAADDPLVKPFEAEMMAGYEGGHPLQETVEIRHGGHAYYFDRWWQQESILTYFKQELPAASADSTIGVAATVNQTPGGVPLHEQLVSLGHPTPAQAGSHLAPYVCDTSAGSPG